MLQFADESVYMTHTELCRPITHSKLRLTAKEVSPKPRGDM